MSDVVDKMKAQAKARKDTLPYAETPKEGDTMDKETEPKDVRFKRVATMRMESAIKAIRAVGRLGASDRYEWTTEQKDAIFSKLSLEVRRAKSKYKKTPAKKKAKQLFKFE